MSNNQNKTFIALPGGETCKPINPHHKNIQIEFEPPIWKVNPEWQKFEANNPVLTITEVMPEGETFNGSEVLKVRCSITGELFDNLKELHLSKNHYREPYTYITAIKPIKATEPVNLSYLERNDTCEKCVGTGQIFIEKSGVEYPCVACEATGKVTDKTPAAVDELDLEERDYKKEYENLLHQVKDNISYLYQKAHEYENTTHEDLNIKATFEGKSFAYKWAANKLIKSLEWLGIEY